MNKRWMEKVKPHEHKEKKSYASMKDMKDELESIIKKMRERSLNSEPDTLTRGATSSDPQTNSNISNIRNAKDEPFLSP